MNQYYFSWIRGMQRPKRFYLKIYKNNITIRLWNTEIIIYRPRIYKIRKETY